MLVPAGALAADGSWRPATKPGRKLYLVSDRVLAEVFAGKYLALAKRLLPDEVAVPTIEEGTHWIVAIRRVEPGPEAVLSYLGRYVHRTALDDRTLLACDDDSVTFRYRDSRTGQSKPMRLPAHEFLRRLLQHGLPQGFHRVRCYGLLHPNQRLTLRHLQLLLGDPTATGDDSPACAPRFRCPHCRAGALILVRSLTPEECFARLEHPKAARDPPATSQPGAQP